MRPLSRCSVLVALLFAATQIPAQIIVTNAYIAFDSTVNYRGISGTPTITANGGLGMTDVPEVSNYLLLALAQMARFTVSPGTILSPPKPHEFGWFAEHLGTVVGPASGWNQFIDATVPDR